MAFIIHAGKTKTIKLPVTPSTALSANSLVIPSSGLLIAATTTSSKGDTLGVLIKAIAAADADYADTRLVSVKVPVEKLTEWLGDVTSGLVATDIGLECDLTSATHINRGGSTYDIVKIKRVISTTKGIVWINFQGSY